MRHCSLMVRNLLMQHIGSPQHICITGPGEFSRAGFQIKGMVWFWRHLSQLILLDARLTYAYLDPDNQWFRVWSSSTITPRRSRAR